MKILQKWAATVAIPLALTGCAGTELHQGAVTSNDLHEARRQMDSAPLPAEKGTAGYEQHTMVKRVEERIRPATQKVCKRTLEAETCQRQYAKIKVSVKPADETINAYADVNGNVVFYGGLVRRAGSDDEIAGVMGGLTPLWWTVDGFRRCGDGREPVRVDCARSRGLGVCTEGSSGPRPARSRQLRHARSRWG